VRLAEALRGHFTAQAYFLDSSLGAIDPRDSPLADALGGDRCCGRRGRPELRAGTPVALRLRASSGRLLSKESGTNRGRSPDQELRPG
jgi:hypothetical protein